MIIIIIIIIIIGFFSFLFSVKPLKSTSSQESL